MKVTTEGKVAIAVITLLGAAGAIFILKKFAPEAVQEQREEVLPTVEVLAVESTSTSVQIATQGVLEAPTETMLASEVGGMVVSVDPGFEVGSQFSKGDVLAEIDPADYASVLAQMEANVADAELNLALEQGRARQAERDWKSVGTEGEASDLVLRKPQLKSASAKLTSAKAAVEKARRDLERTKIRAPYDCQIRADHIEVGAFLAPGARVADVFEIGGYEVRLPVPLDDFAFIEESGIGTEVKFTTEIAGELREWSGKITRDEGFIDRASRSVYLVAKIEPDDSNKFLSPGLFVKASIAGQNLDNVIALPRKALYGKNRVYVIGSDNKLSFRDVDVARTEQDRVIVVGGLEPGERVSTTNLAAAIDQMKVRILGENDAAAGEPESGSESDSDPKKSAPVSKPDTQPKPESTS